MVRVLPMELASSPDEKLLEPDHREITGYLSIKICRND
jgi:hypothetical protein